MKKMITLAALSAALLLTGCSNTTEVSYDECNYPDAPGKTAPGWVCEQPVDGLTVQAVGYSRKLASGPGMMTDVAAAEARSRLASFFATEVQARMSRLTSDSNIDKQINSKDVTERIQKTLTAMTLTKSRLYRTQVTPVGGMYVLVGLDKKAYDENVDALVKTAVGQDSPELYQQFLKDESDKALEHLRQQLNQEYPPQKAPEKS